jgi:hypothetical protein
MNFVIEKCVLLLRMSFVIEKYAFVLRNTPSY